MSHPDQRPGPGPVPADELAVLRRWLAAEAADDGRAAEAEARRAGAGPADTAVAAEGALGALFAVLPRPAPAPGLADRVLAAARPERRARPASRRVGLRRWLGGATGLQGTLVPRLAAALLVAAGLAVAAGGGLVGLLAGRLTPASAIRGAADATLGLASAIGRWAGAALELLETAFRLAGALATAATTGPVAGSLTASLLLAALSFAVLHHVFESDRSLSHASHAPIH